MVTVRGQHRRSADVVGELMDVLADQPRVVACDLAGMTAEGSAMLAKGFAPVSEYLRHWPGTVVKVYAPDAQLRSRLSAAMSGEHQPQPCAPSVGELPQCPLAGSGLRLVQTLARGWGVIPTRKAGKTVWVVLDTATGQRHRSHIHRQQASAAHEASRR